MESRSCHPKFSFDGNQWKDISQRTIYGACSSESADCRIQRTTRKGWRTGSLIRPFPDPPVCGMHWTGICFRPDDLFYTGGRTWNPRKTPGRRWIIQSNTSWKWESRYSLYHLRADSQYQTRNRTVQYGTGWKHPSHLYIRPPLEKNSRSAPHLGLSERIAGDSLLRLLADECLPMGWSFAAPHHRKHSGTVDCTGNQHLFIGRKTAGTETGYVERKHEVRTQLTGT